MKENQIFSNNFAKTYEKSKDPINLSCVSFIETKENILIVPYTKFTNIQNTIQINKKKWSFQTLNIEKTKENFKRTKYYSLFMGIFQYQTKTYLLFADQVIYMPFVENTKIFQICSIKAMSLQNYSSDKFLSNCLSVIYQRGFYFSYDFDITRTYSEENRERFKKIKNPLWLFYTNYNLHTPILQNQYSEWLIPVIFGFVLNSTTKFEQIKKVGHFRLIIRISLLDLTRGIIGQLNINNLTITQSFHYVDLFIGVQDKLAKFSIVLTGVPQNINKEKAERYLTFLFLNFNCLNLQFFEKNEFKEYEELTKKDNIKINVLNKNDNQNVFEQFQENIIKNVNYGKFKNTSVAFCDNNEDFLLQTFFPNLLGIFIVVIKNRLFQGDDFEYEEVRTLINDLEMKLSVKLKMYKLFIANLQSLTNYNLQMENNNESNFNNFTDSLRSIGRGTNEGLKENVADTSVNIMSQIFNVWEKIIEEIYKNQDESKFIEQELSIGIIIHNCSGFRPVYEVNKHQFFYHQHELTKNKDILIVGLQEILAMKPNNLKSILLEDNSETKYIWREFLEKLFDENYYLFFTKNILGIYTLVFVNKNCSQQFTLGIEGCDIIRLGKMNLANKASIYLKLSINHQIIQICNSHLASGIKDSDCQKRIENLKKIFGQIEGQQTDLTFIIGDLNFRNKTPMSDIQKMIDNYNKVKDSSQKQVYLDQLLLKEELSKILKTKEFSHLSEHQITFLPSYKYNQGQHGYDYMEGKRIPSHTDRILMIKKKDVIKVEGYNLDKKTAVSDHKPVILGAKIKVKKMSNKDLQEEFDKKFWIILTHSNQLKNQRLILKNDLQ